MLEMYSKVTYWDNRVTKVIQQHAVASKYHHAFKMQNFSAKSHLYSSAFNAHDDFYFFVWPRYQHF